MNNEFFKRLREFGEEMARDILLVMLKKGLDGESYE